MGGRIRETIGERRACWEKYVEETRVLSFLLATGRPVPPLTVCRQQIISGPGWSSKGKWEDI